MKLKDCVLLGSVKLRLRRRRTIVSCVALSLLFGFVVMLLMVSSAFFNGLLNTSNKVFDGKIYMEVSLNTAPEYHGDVVDRAAELYEASDSPDKVNPVLTMTPWGEETDPYLDSQNEFARIALEEYYVRTRKEVGGELAAKTANYGGEVVDSGLKLYSLKNGRIDETEEFPDSYYAPGNTIEVMSREVLERYITATMPDDMEAVPIVINDVQAGRLLGLRGLRTNVSSKERYERYEYVREHAAGLTFENKVVESGGYEDEDGVMVPEVSRQVKYFVVGVMPVANSLTGRSDWDIINTFFNALSTYRYEGDSFMPEGYESEYIEANYSAYSGGIWNVVAFDDVGKAAKYLEDERCVGYCSSERKQIREFVTNQTDVYFFSRDFNTWVTVLALFFGLIGLFVMMGVFSRIIGEERQATAIFRAVGASKKDIRKIYLVYALMLSGIVAASAIVIGLLGSTVMHFIYAGELTFGARAMYGVAEGGVWLVGFDVRILMVVAVIVFIGALDCLMLSEKMITKSIVNDLKE